jgi:Coenzyme PQQ synthesis protein D (PqqD)
MSGRYEKINPDVIFTKVEGGSVLLNMKTGIYYGLDEIGTLIFEKIEENKNIHEIAEFLANQYNEDKKVSIEDVSKFIYLLKSKSLIQGE